MSTALQATPTITTADQPLSLYRLNIHQFDRMLAAGVFAPDDRVELLGGVLVAKMTKNPPHDYTISQLAKLLERLLNPDEWVVREEKTALLGLLWRPEPDLAVARGPLQRYRRNHARAKDFGLLIEVTGSAHAADLLKWRGYAAARIPFYWNIDLDRRVVEVHSRPSGRGETARYRATVVHAPGSAVPLILDAHELGLIPVDDILP